MNAKERQDYLDYLMQDSHVTVRYFPTVKAYQITHAYWYGETGYRPISMEMNPSHQRAKINLNQKQNAALLAWCEAKVKEQGQ